MLVRSPLLASHRWRELVSPRRMSCCLSLVLRLFCFCFVFVFFAFIKAAALRSITLRVCAPTVTRASSIFFFLLEMSLFPKIVLVPLPVSLCMESTSHVFHFRMVFFYLVTTGWMIDIRLFEISINRSIKSCLCPLCLPSTR